MKTGSKPRLADILAIAFSVLVTAASAFGAARASGGGDTVFAEADGKAYAYPLPHDARIALKGPLGDTVLLIEGGTARIEASPCDNKLCIAMGRISKGGQWISCLPNKVLVRIGGGGTDVDASAY
jgi:hypothetical protein